MKKSLLIAIAAGAMLACGCVNNNPEALLKRVSEVYKDSTATSKDVLKAVTPYAELLLEQASDTARANTNKRLDAQWKASNTIFLLADKVTEMRRINQDVEFAAFDTVFGTLNKVIDTWVYNDGVLFHEANYMSAEGTENATMGHFQIDVILPTEEDPEVCVTICFPASAENTPFAVFGEGKDYYPISGAYAKGTMAEGSPLFAVLGEDFLNAMLDNESMYLGFRSDIPTDDSYDGIELAHMRLGAFHEAYQAVK